jgi:integrase
MFVPRPAPLTPTFLRHLKLPAAGQVEIADGGCPGLRLRPSTSTATWVLGCRDASGKSRRFVLGSYPVMGLKAARDAAHRLRQEVRGGRDPIAEERLRRAAARAPGNGGAARPVSLADVLDAYERLVGAKQRSWRRARQQIVNVFRGKLARPAGEVTGSELQLLVDAHPSIASAGAAVRYFKPVARWAAKRDLMAPAIVNVLDQPKDAQRKRDRVLSRDEIKMIFLSLEIVPRYCHVLRWLFWTACRLDEACSMRWRDIDLDRRLWTISQTKQDKVHVVPLPWQAVALLNDRHRDGTDGLVFVNAIGNKLGHWDAATKRIQAASGTSSWHRHDIRRSVATIMGDIGVAPHIIEVALGHALRTSSNGSPVSRIAEIYNKSRYRAEHTDALQRLADELSRIEAGEDNVVLLRA